MIKGKNPIAMSGGLIRLLLQAYTQRKAEVTGVTLKLWEGHRIQDVVQM